MADRELTIEQTLSFFKSVILCGEAWSSTCQARFDSAQARLVAKPADEGVRDGRLWKAAKAVALHRPLAKQVCHIPTALMHELVDSLIQDEGNAL